MKKIDEITSLLTDRIGLEPDSIGRKSIEITINTAMKIAGFLNLDDYLSSLYLNDGIFLDLIEEIKVPETWFFRDNESFNFVRTYFLNLRQNALSNKIRILSIPCSTGEEPYSVMITLLDLGYKQNDFSIIGCDISQQNIDFACKAKYGKSSFRNENIRFKEKYFIEMNGNFYLKEEFKNIVKFKKDNLLNENFLGNESQFDIIYCKNLLIYFNEKSKLNAIVNLKKLLKDDGILISGHSELSFFARNGFDRIDIASAFALKKSNPNSKKIPLIKKEQIKYSQEIKSKNFSPKIKSEINLEIPKNDFQINSNKIFDSEFARVLANQGKFEEAENYCLFNVKQEQANYELFFILGLINSSKNNIDAAIEYYNKAIYLNPNHYESLFNLSLIFESIGQIEKSEIFKMRAIRNYKNE